MKYKISEVSKITGIPIDSIRYYVKNGIVSPEKIGSYAYFEAWDINYLLDYKKYRDLGMGLEDIKNIFQKDNSSTLLNRFYDLQKEYEFKEKYYHYLSIKNKRYISRTQDISKYVNHYIETTMPKFYCLPHRRNHKYIINEENHDMIKFFRKMNSFLEGIVVFDYDNVMSTEPEDDYNWFLGIEKDFATPFMHEEENIMQIGGGKALYTVIVAYGEGTFSVNSLKKALEYVKKSNYIITDDIVGILLSKVHEENEFIRYIGMWIPVK